MGKFENILLCTDLDDTLLTTDKKISAENKKAIEYFMSEGGLFTFATGRVPYGAKLLLKYVTPNAPMVCFNGGGVYDFKNDKIIWSRKLSTDALKVVEYIENMFDFVGIEICTEDKIYFSKMNRIVSEHKIFEQLPDNALDYHDVKEPWQKVLFMTEENQLQAVKDAIANSPFADTFTYVQSSPWYYEILPKNATKGEGLIHLADILGIDYANTIGIGDNENDIDLVRMAGMGIAVFNAVDAVKDVADYITVDNNSHAIAAVIYALEQGKIKGSSI